MRSHATRNQIGRQARVAPVSLIAFLRMVDWSTMTITSDGSRVRRLIAARNCSTVVYHNCPIVEVWGGLNVAAVQTATDRGMTFDDAAAIVHAADAQYLHEPRTRIVRAAMLALVRRARQAVAS